MDLRLRDIAETLSKDGNSGASQMMASTLNSLLAIPDESLVNIPSAEWEEFAIALHKAKPSIAPLFNIANTILLLIEQAPSAIHFLRLKLMELQERERRSALRITELSVDNIPGNRFMTTSYSSTVAQVLKTMARSREIKVVVAEAIPGGEGRQFAKQLSGYDMEVEIIHDSTAFARMEGMDAVLVGADSVTMGGVVNKVGTRVLVEAARVFGVKAYAVCGWSKVSPVALSDLVVYENVLERNLVEYVQVFESTPLDLFTLIITDLMALPPADILKELQGKKVAQAWYSRKVLTPAKG